MKILISLDALSDSSRRQIDGSDFDSYYSDQINDEPNNALIQIVRALGQEFELVVYTTMPEEWRAQIETWLIDNDVPIDDVLMRTGYGKNIECVVEMVNSIDAPIQAIITSDVREADVLREEFFVMEV